MVRFDKAILHAQKKGPAEGRPAFGDTVPGSKGLPAIEIDLRLRTQVPIVLNVESPLRPTLNGPTLVLSGPFRLVCRQVRGIGHPRTHIGCEVKVAAFLSLFDEDRQAPGELLPFAGPKQTMKPENVARVDLPGDPGAPLAQHPSAALGQ